ncbi:hypothetical protein [Piscibacillus salipiscarius]|uniref:hypothetical protein n=1 Tax=Piscibacillus salipiscarius TaxID=299480 RepID=UPI0006D13492|nr:hypothetical protein [Piscibacillus salipiscarius]
MAELDYIQFQQLNNELNTCDEFTIIYDELHSNNLLRGYVTAEVRRYIKEFSKSKDRLEREIRKITYFDDQEDFMREEHIRAFKDSYKEMQQRYLSKLKCKARNFDCY